MFVFLVGLNIIIIIIKSGAPRLSFMLIGP